jgi:hypothetical protein
MKDENKAKLQLPRSEKVLELSFERQSQLRGGEALIFTTFGHKCSLRAKCSRLWTVCWGGTKDRPCTYDSGVDS